MRLLSTDELTGVSEHVGFDGDKVIIKRTQNNDAVIEQNKLDNNNARTNWTGDMHHVARVPNSIIDSWNLELKRQGHPNPNMLASENAHLFLRKLNDYNFAKLRTKTGRI